MKRKLKILINILFFTVLIIFVVIISKIFLNNKKTNDTYNQIKNISISDSKNTNSINFDKLKLLNPDFKAWLNIDNTNIDYPVVQGTDNDFYLKHDFNKKELKSGCLFLDYNSNFTNDFNTIIFGHNQKDKTMFENLTKFKEKNFFNQDNKITITDNKYKYTYQVFSVYVAKGSDNFNYLYAVNQENLSNSEKLKYLDFLKSKSMFSSNLNLNDTSHILTLITCSYEFENARTIVHAKLIDKVKI